MIIIATGNNTIEQVQLLINDEPLTAAPLTVTALLVEKNRRAKYMAASVDQDPSSANADWDTGLVTVVIPGSDTSGITYQGSALLEVKASFSAEEDHTWWFPVTIKKGWAS